MSEAGMIETDNRQTYRHRDTETETEVQTMRQTHRHADRQADIHRHDLRRCKLQQKRETRMRQASRAAMQIAGKERLCQYEASLRCRPRRLRGRPRRPRGRPRGRPQRPQGRPRGHVNCNKTNMMRRRDVDSGMPARILSSCILVGPESFRQSVMH